MAIEPSATYQGGRGGSILKPTGFVLLSSVSSVSSVVALAAVAIICSANLAVAQSPAFGVGRPPTADEVYAASAYVLFLNGIVHEQDVLDQTTLPQVKMPNRDGFVVDPRPDVGAAPSGDSPQGTQRPLRKKPSR